VVVDDRIGWRALTDRVSSERELAEVLLATEISRLGDERNATWAPGLSDAEIALASGERALQLVQEHLRDWFGPDGVDALLIRALERARSSHPILIGVQPPVSGTLRLIGITENDRAVSQQNGALDSREIIEGIVALLAAILALIARLVGDEMMRHLVKQIWPVLPDDASLPNDSPNNHERSGK